MRTWSLSEILIAVQNEEGEDAALENPQAIIPTTLPWLSYTFPMGEFPAETLSDMRLHLASYLPDAIEARRLVDLYFKHAAWMYVIGTRGT